MGNVTENEQRGEKVACVYVYVRVCDHTKATCAVSFLSRGQWRKSRACVRYSRHCFTRRSEPKPKQCKLQAWSAVFFLFSFLRLLLFSAFIVHSTRFVWSIHHRSTFWLSTAQTLPRYTPLWVHTQPPSAPLQLLLLQYIAALLFRACTFSSILIHTHAPFCFRCRSCCATLSPSSSSTPDLYPHKKHHQQQ